MTDRARARQLFQFSASESDDVNAMFVDADMTTSVESDSVYDHFFTPNRGTSIAATAQSSAPPPSGAIFRFRRNTERAFLVLDSFRTSEQLCDVLLIAGGAPDECSEAEAAEVGGERCQLHAHRVVLAACSPYFRAMFAGEMVESRMNRVYIQGVDPTALAILVDYMYTSQVHLTENNVQILLPASSLLQLTEVRNACCDFLKAQLHPTNCLGIFAFAELHDCDQLLKAANTFTEQHFSELIQTEEFLSLNCDQLARLISSDRLTTTGEEKVFESVINWVRYDRDRRRHELPLLMEYVRLPLLTQDYLIDKVDSEPLVRESVVCKDFLIEALKYHLIKSENRLDYFKSPRVKPRQPIGIPKLLMVIGGQAPKAIRNVDVYDVLSEKWSSVSELPQRRCRCGVGQLGESVYAVGGFNGSLRVRTVDIFDATRNCWLSGPSMEARRSTLGVAVIDGRLVAVGGFDGSTGLNSAEALDPRVGEWHMIASMSTRRSSVGVSILNGCLYAVGGYDGQSRQCLSSVERWEPRMDCWSPVADMTTRRSGAGVTSTNDRLLAIGGHDGPMVKRSAEIYDCDLDVWRSIADMSLCRRNAGVLTGGNGLVYAVGGDDGTMNLASVEQYNLEKDAWSTLPSLMSMGRSYAGVAMLNRAS